MISRLFLIVSSIVFATPGPAQVLWTQASPPTSPAARMNAAMADAPADSVLLFGGSSGLLVEYSDTWVWDGGAGNWVLIVTPSAPSGRAWHAMAYDEARHEVVLFGGRKSNGVGVPPTYYNDTWVWNGSAWTRVVTGGSVPSPRSHHAMAYDPTRGRIVLFGGLDANGQWLGDTWEYSAGVWRDVTPPVAASMPRPRGGHGLAALTRLPPRVVLFGGTCNDGELGDTWEWDGTQWLQREPAASPAARASFAMVRDSARDRAILLGGARSVPPFGLRVYDDTWEWDGSEWKASTYATHPGTRYGHSMAFNAYRLPPSFEPQVVTFGGSATQIVNPLRETWLGEVWRPARFSNFGAGCGGSLAPPTLVDVDASRPWIGETLRMRIAPAPTPSAIGVLGFSNTSWNGIPLPMPLSGPPLYLGLGCTLYVSIDVTFALTGGATIDWPLPMADDPNVVGLTAWLQAFVVDPGATGGLVVTNAATIVVGMRQ
ncbi:MAG: hypothetical protein IPM29_07085 [Planctomycetes bacterium]|nr:hypothetical protein [Planctomycetota bacterium]